MKEIFCHIDSNNIIQGWNTVNYFGYASGCVSIFVPDDYTPYVGYDKIIDGRLESHKAEWQHAQDMFAHNDELISTINILKKSLADTDYLATKHSEGLISEEDYAPIKAERQGWRDQINELEAQLWTE